VVYITVRTSLILTQGYGELEIRSGLYANKNVAKLTFARCRYCVPCKVAGLLLGRLLGPVFCSVIGVVCSYCAI